MAFVKNMVEVVRDDMSSLKKLYKNKVIDISKEMKTSEKSMYVKALTLCYSVIDAPKQLLINKFGGWWGKGFSYLYSIFIDPFRSIISLFDSRTYVGIWLTIVSLVKNCLIAPVRSFIDKIINGISGLFDTILKYFGFKKRIQKQSLHLESKKKQLLEFKLLSWLKKAAAAVLRPFKNVIWNLFKAGYNIVESLFLKAIYPVCECITKSNKLKMAPGTIAAIGGGLQQKIKAPPVTQFLKKYTVKSMVPFALSSLGLFGSFMTQLGVISITFTIAGYLSMFGGVLVFKNALVDAFSEL